MRDQLLVAQGIALRVARLDEHAEHVIRRVLAAFGWDESSWRIDETPHPFASKPGFGDIRLTTHADERDLTSLFSTIRSSTDQSSQRDKSKTIWSAKSWLFKSSRIDASSRSRGMMPVFSSPWKRNAMIVEYTCVYSACGFFRKRFSMSSKPSGPRRIMRKC